MKLAGLQFAAQAGGLDANLARLRAGARAAADQGAQLLVAPELAVTGYGAAPDFLRRSASPIDGAVPDAVAAIARETGLAIVAGFPERRGGAVHNSALFTDGAERRAYAKTHLWGEHERAAFTPGPREPAVFAHAGLRLGLLICYDLEFPENARALARAGAELLIAPTALPEGPEAALISDAMIRVRAFENQVFVAYVGLCGSDGRFAYAGSSHVAAPDGGTLARAGVEEGLILATIDPAAYAESRARNPYLRDLDG